MRQAHDFAREAGLCRRHRWVGVFAIIVLTGTCDLTATATSAEEPAEGRANRLINSANPYLLQHAHNPVDWYPWGEEAIARAKKENKPIFVSIGYSTCYWCHVAERTIYSNASIAALMNQWFVNIKVDREERPDVDETYMLARNLMTGSGGWPNNLFLTPDLKPFFAGSYFPPEDRAGMLGFPGILRLIHATWENEPSKVKAVGNEVYAALSRVGDSQGKTASAATLVPADWLITARDQMLRRRDKLAGGFDGGGGTKFPQSPVLGLLLTDYRLNGTRQSLETVAEALNAMAYGGIHDHLAGGIHRYSTEPSWSVPHFEKMLYDNAQLLGLYADLYAIARQPLARQMAGDIYVYLTRRMMTPEGAFYTAEDAEIDGKEGESYRWSRAEITQLLGAADAERFFAVYELIPVPTEPGGPGVLRVHLDRTTTIEERMKLDRELKALAPLRAKLLEARDRRKQPLRDEKIVVALNGLAIAALARAGAVLGEPAWVSSAKRAAEFLFSRAFDEKTGRLRRHLYRGEARGEGFLDDYALLALGFLALTDASGEAIWSTRAGVLADAIVKRFVKADGAVITTAPDTTLIVPAVDLQDHDTPSGTSSAYALLARLGKTEPRYADLAMKILTRAARKIEASPQSWASLTASAAQFATSVQTAAAPLDSAAHVKATARGQSSGDHDAVVVTIAIDSGYHVNANPASLDYLIPTKVSISGVPDAKISYPAGQLFTPKFLPEGILVYEGSLSIKIELPIGSLAKVRSAPVDVEVQACDLQICLPPSTLAVQIGQ
jgi:uncharacterized protein